MTKDNKDSVQKRLILENAVTEKEKGKKAVSYSQYSVFRDCPFRWELTYKDGLFPFTSNINSVFGTALHETLQEYLTLLYTKSVKSSEEFNFNEYLSDRLVETYQKEVEENGGAHFIPKEEMKEYYADGIEILEYLRRKRKVLFDYRNVELISIELAGYIPVLDGNDNIVFNYYLDIVMYDRVTKKYIIIDVKTSKNGWKQGGYEMKSQLKMDQVLLYKHYFSKHYKINPDDVEVKFLIVKRKVFQFEGFQTPRHKVHIPAQGDSRVKLAVAGLENFVKTCFNEDGSFQDKKHPKTPSKSACRFCPYAGTDYCDMVAE